MSDLREDLAEAIRELDCYTPDYFREKWDHDGIIARLDRVHAALLDVAEAAQEESLWEVVTASDGVASIQRSRLGAALDRLEEVRRD